MGSLSNYLENELLDHILGTSYTAATTIYLALATADPTDAGTGASMNECANSGAYARQAITFGAAASRVVTQNATVTFPQATGSWGTVSHWAIVDSATHGAGNMLAHGAFGASKSIVTNNTPSVASSEITITVSAGFVSNYLANIMLDFAFRNQAFTAPATYVALTTATIADTNTGSTITEVSAGGYARVQVNANGGASPAWTLASAGAASNGAAIDIGPASASWGTVVAACLCDAASAGNLLLYDNAVTDQAVGNGDTVTFATGDFDVSLD